MYLWLVNAVETLRRDEGQGVSEYAMILVLIVLIVVSVVHAIGSNAQQVIDRVNAALHIG
jgi:Flp pilus assembly pilin Flp